MDLSSLRPLYVRPGPWVSAYLDASHDTEDAGKALELRWRAAAEKLADQGAEPAALEALGQALPAQQPQPGRYGLALFAPVDARSADEVIVEPLTAPPRKEIATVGPLPHAMPLVAQRGEEVAWVRVLADRTGADLTSVAVGGAPRRRAISGSEEYPLHKAQPGGWSQPRYQRAAEQAWQRNAGDVARAAVDLAEAVGAEVLVVAGDVRAVQLLVDELPDRWRERVVRTDAGSRAAGADPAALDEATIEAIAEVAAEHTEAALERYREQLGAQGPDHPDPGAAGSGLAATVAALQRGQVDILLLVDDPSSDAQLWIGPEPLHVAMVPEQLRDLGVGEPQRARADAAILRAAVATDADLVLVGPDEAPLDGGIGAVLRYADAGTRRR